LASARRLVPLLTVVFVAGCSHGGFDRFMDHPILSWLPLDKWGVVGEEGNETEKPSAQFPDKKCFEAAYWRTAFLDKSEYSDSDRRKMLALIYQDCIKAKN
jgi:hypothetical protein